MHAVMHGKSRHLLNLAPPPAVFSSRLGNAYQSTNRLRDSLACETARTLSMAAAFVLWRVIEASATLPASLLVRVQQLQHQLHKPVVNPIPDAIRHTRDTRTGKQGLHCCLTTGLRNHDPQVRICCILDTVCRALDPTRRPKAFSSTGCSITHGPPLTGGRCLQGH